MSKKEKRWCTYVLVGQDGGTYTGYTWNIELRLRKHNGELKGGALSTKLRAKGVAKFWSVGFLVIFDNKRDAMSAETRIKRSKIGTPPAKLKLTPLQRRFWRWQRIRNLLPAMKRGQVVVYDEECLLPD